MGKYSAGEAREKIVEVRNLVKIAGVATFRPLDFTILLREFGGPGQVMRAENLAKHLKVEITEAQQIVGKLGQCLSDLGKIQREEPHIYEQGLAEAEKLWTRREEISAVENIRKAQGRPHKPEIIRGPVKDKIVGFGGAAKPTEHTTPSKKRPE